MSLSADRTSVVVNCSSPRYVAVRVRATERSNFLVVSVCLRVLSIDDFFKIFEYHVCSRYGIWDEKQVLGFCHDGKTIMRRYRGRIRSLSILGFGQCGPWSLH